MFTRPLVAPAFEKAVLGLFTFGIFHFDRSLHGLLFICCADQLKLHHSAVAVVIVLQPISLCQLNTLSSCRPHFFSSKVVSTQPRVNSSPFHICFLFLFFPIVPPPLRSAGHNVVETLHCCHSASICVTCRHVTFH